jgi:enamine deaminase RidA (YjgF/YER057c/UK114 family)
MALDESQGQLTEVVALSLMDSRPKSSKEEAMTRKIVQPKGLWDPRPRFAQVVQSGKQIYIAGQTSVDEQGNVVGKGDIEAQTRQIFQNLRKCLESVGAGFDHVVKLNIYSTDLDAHSSS